ncbi:MAG: BON domain-containing protein [Pirellulales bacterium]|nr:BON domain-containing protein [Pirellulales bacterium]
MFNRGSASDKAIFKKANQHLARVSLGSRSRVVLTIRGGQATLSGNIQYESQRRPAVKAISSVDGVRGVLDQLKVLPRDAPRKQPPPQTATPPNTDAAAD